VKLFRLAIEGQMGDRLPERLATVTKYDESTGLGDESFTNYDGGTCIGATFNSAGATEASFGTRHFVVTQEGRKIFAATTTLQNKTGAIGGFSNSFTEEKSILSREIDTV
jgi:hypothetical protein